MKQNTYLLQEYVVIPEARPPVPRWKRVLDLLAILVALPVLVPVVATIALLIKLSSKGPVFFKQHRVGYLGQTFLCWKFRTMKLNADTGVHKSHLDQVIRSELPMTKMDSFGDPRLIPFGAILRATGLDELPQLINVVRGEMSIVGPRPCLPYEYELYLPWQKQRFDTLPGLTGLWQVSGKNKTTFSEMIRLDISYARNLSLGLDLKIMSKTVSALVLQVRETKAAKNSGIVDKGLSVVARS